MGEMSEEKQRKQGVLLKEWGAQESGSEIKGEIIWGFRDPGNLFVHFIE